MSNVSPLQEFDVSRLLSANFGEFLTVYIEDFITVANIDLANKENPDPEALEVLRRELTRLYYTLKVNFELLEVNEENTPLVKH